MMKPSAAALLIACAACAPAGGVEMVPFVIPFKPNPKSLIKLPATPAFAPGGARIVAHGPHFRRGGKRVRIWGVNLCFGANFPRHEDAAVLADRLAAFGVNSVRHHHMDTAVWPRGIWDRGDHTKLSAEALDRLDYLIDRLARRGICSNINLHVGRAHSQYLKLPDAKDLHRFDKVAALYTPEIIAAQKTFARRLLTRVNRYRKVRYADDPAVAFVEITNENSFFRWPADHALGGLPPYYKRLLRKQYVAWLRARHGTTARLRAAWARGAQPLGPPLLEPMTLRGGKWALAPLMGTKTRFTKTKAGVRVEITKGSDTYWHVQLNHTPVTLEAGRFYTLIFRARADKPRKIVYNVGMAHAPWKTLGLSRDVELTDFWKAFRVGFIAAADDEKARVSLNLAGDDAAVELADVQLYTGGRVGLAEAETLEAGNVTVYDDAESEGRALDRLRFLAETEKAYFDGMYAFIKNDLGCKALVAGTIVYGPLGLYAQSGMDYIDAHSYWQHPHFPGRPWDPNNWNVPQKAMVDHPEESELFRLAGQRLAGKPYTVSEYNHPAPNDFQAECVPMIASFASAQDWDGVWLFAYCHRTNDWAPGHFSSYFDFDHNPAKWGFMPAGTIIFREGGIAPNERQRIASFCREGSPLTPMARAQLRHGRSLFAFVANSTKATWADACGERWSVRLVGEGEIPVELKDTRPLTKIGDGVWVREGILLAPPTPSPCIIWSGADERRHGHFMAMGDRATATAAGGLILRLFGPSDRLVHPRFAAMTVTALDGSDVAKTRSALVTVCGRSENSGMEFSKDRRTVGRNWGQAPVRIEPVTGTLRWGAAVEKWRCRALKQDGTPGENVPLLKAPDVAQLMFRADPKYKTMWYLLTRE